MREVIDAWYCFCITYDFYRSDPMHLRANCVVLKLSQLCNHPTRLPTPSSGKSKCNCCHRIQNTSFFDSRCFYLCRRRISTEKLKIYLIDGSKHCTKIKCNTIIIAPRRHKYPSSSVNRPFDIAVTVNINDEFHLSLI